MKSVGNMIEIYDKIACNTKKRQPFFAERADANK